MRGYRLFCLNSLGAIIAVNTVECEGDEEALVHAQAMLDGEAPCHGIEIWEGARRVALLPPPKEV